MAGRNECSPPHSSPVASSRYLDNLLPPRVLADHTGRATQTSLSDVSMAFAPFTEGIPAAKARRRTPAREPRSRLGATRASLPEAPLIFRTVYRRHTCSQSKAQHTRPRASLTSLNACHFRLFWQIVCQQVLPTGDGNQGPSQRPCLARRLCTVRESPPHQRRRHKPCCVVQYHPSQPQFPAG